MKTINPQNQETHWTSLSSINIKPHVTGAKAHYNLLKSEEKNYTN